MASNLCMVIEPVFHKRISSREIGISIVKIDENFLDILSALLTGSISHKETSILGLHLMS
jgi:hypothetical protein